MEGKLNLTIATMTILLFYIESRIRYIDYLKRVYSYLWKSKCSAMWFITEESNLSDLYIVREESIYGKVKKVLPINILEPLEK